MIGITDYERQEEVGRIDDDGWASEDDVFVAAVDEATTDDGGVPVLEPMADPEDEDKHGGYAEVVIEPGQEGFARALIEQLPSPLIVSDQGRYQNLPRYD